MKVVTSHQNLDFDGLAAMVAYYKLDPQVKMVIPGKMNQNVRAFYSLHKDVFPFKEKINFDMEQVSKLVLVDTRDENRIGALKAIISTVQELIVYDHHPEGDLSVEPTQSTVEEVGATSTLIVEELRRQEIPLDPLEATVIALGIYEDTGNLTYPSTKPRDLEAVQFLLESGANLNVVRDYVTLSLSRGQRDLLDELLENIEYLSINEYNIGISVAEHDDYLNGAAVLVHKLMELENVDLFFIIVKMVKRVYIIGRSRRDELNVKRILNPFDGRGHPQAASAVIKHGKTEQLKHELIESLRIRLPVHITAQNIMSSPVKTIHQDMEVQKAEELLIKYGHNGLPVVEGDEIVGIISRRDIEKAKHHGFGHSPVKGYMSQKVITISPKTSLKRIQYLIVKNNIGRLPVIDEHGNLVGIVTRTDLLQIQHGIKTNKLEEIDPHLQEIDETTEDLTELMNQRLPKKTLGILYLIGQKADKEGYKVYGVGGFIRDLLMGKDNLDIDLVVEKNAIDFAHLLKGYLNCAIKTFPQFQTARLILANNLRIDLATARIEFYAFPAASPEVEESTIKQDLFRRDFTINTLAVELNGSTFGRLLDFFNSRGDLKNGIVRVLYNLSFVEDPTRIFRAIRFETRFNFRIEEQTLVFMKNSLATGVLEKLPGEKLFEELRNLIYEEQFVKGIRRLDELGILNSIFPDLKITETKMTELKNIKDIIAWYEQYQQHVDSEKENAPVSKEALVLSTLLSDMPYPIVSSICDRLKMPAKVRDVVLETIKRSRMISQELTEDKKNSELVQILENIPLETILYVLSQKNNYSIKEKLYRYLKNLKGVGVTITGEDLKNLGIKPGPEYRKALEEVRRARLDGIVNTQEEELEFVLDFFEKGDT